MPIKKRARHLSKIKTWLSSIRLLPGTTQTASDQVYGSLCPSRKEIRLLEIVETSPGIICQLSTVSLIESPEFCAISYVWGTEKVLETICVNGVTLKITKSLADALRHIPMQWKRATGDQDVTRLRLWADALCINQEDTDEKNYQVPLMEEIYPAATISFCCLDSVSATSKLPIAIQSLSVIAARIVDNGFDAKNKDQEVALGVLENSPSFGCLNPPEHPPTTENLVSTENQPSSDTGPLAELWAALKDGPHDKTLRESLDSFTELPYWKRAWIFQEIILSKRAILFYADESIEFETLRMLLEWGEKAMRQPKPEKFPWESRFLIQQLRFRACFILSYTLEILAFQKTLQGRAKLEKEISALLIHSQVYFGSFLEATNPKDHVYALLGVTGLRITPRYEDTVSVASVYIEFCVEQLKATQETPPFDLGFLRFSGLANEDPKQDNRLPSWVPNFPVCSTKDYYRVVSLDNSEGEITRSWAEAIGTVKDIHIRSSSLFTPCLFIDTVEDMSDFLLDSRSAGSPESYTAFVLSVFRLLKLVASKSSASTETHPFLKLMSAFCRASDPVWSSPHLIRIARMLQYLIQGKSGGAPRPGVWPMGKTFGKDFTTEVLCGADVSQDIEADEETPQAAEAKPCMHGLRLAMMDQIAFMGTDSFLNVARDVGSYSTHGIRVAKTTKGNELVLVPPVAEKGDKIFLLAGYKYACLTRKQDNYHVLVGPVGIAEGVVDSALQQSSLNDESRVRIELR